MFQCANRGHGNTSFSANFVKFGRPEVGEIARYLMDKKNIISALPPEAACARIAPKICQGQLQTIDSEFPKFQPNPFTSGGVIAERANIVQTRHKVFAILGEASASSPSNNSTKMSQNVNNATHCPVLLVLWWISFQMTTLSSPVVFDLPTVKIRPALNASRNSLHISSPSAVAGRYAVRWVPLNGLPGLGWLSCQWKQTQN